MAFSLIVWGNLEFPLFLSGWNWTSLALKRWFERASTPKHPTCAGSWPCLSDELPTHRMLLGWYLDVTWMVLLHLPIFPVKHTPPDSLQQRHCSKPHSSEEPLKDGPWKHGVFFASFLSNVHNSYAIPWYWLLYRDPDAGLLFPIYSLAFIVYQVTGYHNILWENPDKNTEARSFLAVFSIKSILQNAHCKAQWTYIQITSIWRLSFQIYFSEICQATSKMWNP